MAEQYQFQIEEKDQTREKFEMLAMKLDIHKSGILFINEIPEMLEALPEIQREPVHTFLASYYSQTKRSTISLKSFINNITKAYHQGKFGLSKIIEYTELIDENKIKEIIEKSVQKNDPRTAPKSYLPVNRPQASRKASATFPKNNYKERAQVKQAVISITQARVKKSYEQPTQSYLNRKKKERSELEKRYDAEDYTSPGSYFNQPGVDENFTQNVLEKNKLENIAKKNAPIEKAQTTVDRELQKCTFKPHSYTKEKFLSVRARLLDHYKRSESLCEKDMEYIFQKSSLLEQSFNRYNMPLNRSLREPLASSIQSAHQDELKASADIKPSQKSNENGRQSNFMRHESISVKSDYSDYTPQRFNLSTMDFYGRGMSTSPKVNFFDVKSHKNLNYLLKGGYSCKYHERKHYNASKAVNLSNVKNQTLLNTLNASNIGKVDMATSIADWKNVEKTDRSMQLMYNELFNERYRNLTKTLMDNSNDSRSENNLSLRGTSLTNGLKAAKRQSMYRELNFNINLEKLFNGMNSSDLTNVKKMHVLYANQKQQEKKQK